MLSFLNPWLWLGLVAVGAPIWLHLRRKEQQNIVRFSALRFLEDQPVARQSPMRLRDLLLFLLRVLAIAAWVAAFAQPFLAQPIASASSSEVYILDNTLSRQAEKGLEHDRAFLVRQFQNAGPHDQIAVVELTDEPRVVVGFGEGGAQAEAKLNALQPSNRRGTLLSALREADTLIQQSIGERKHITILTDSQQSQWEENTSAPPFLAPGLVSLAPNAGLDNRPNFFVGEPRVNRVFLGDEALVQFSALVGHTGPVSSGTLKLVANGKEIMEHVMPLDAKTDQVSISGQWENDPRAWMVGTIQVNAQPDDLPQDDTAYFTLPPVTEGKVALLTRSLYLKTALSRAVARGHWIAQILQPADLSTLAAAPDDSGADVLMVDAEYLQAPPGRDLVNHYMKNGRGVFIMMGQSSPLLNEFLQQLGFQSSLQMAADGPARLQPIRYFAPESPIFLPFTIPDFTNLLEVRIGTNVHLHPLAAKPLLFSENGDGLLFEVSRGAGRMLLSTFTFDRKQTDWVVHPSFVPFLDSMLQYLRPQGQLNQTLEPGNIWLVQLPVDCPATTAVLRDVRGKELARSSIDQGLHRVTLRAPDDPGVYALTYDADREVRQMLSVNPSLKESDLRYAAGVPDVLRTWTQTTAIPTVDPRVTTILPSTERAAQQILWWKLLLVGSLALLIEMVWLGRRRQSL